MSLHGDDCLICRAIARRIVLDVRNAPREWLEWSILRSGQGATYEVDAPITHPWPDAIQVQDICRSVSGAGARRLGRTGMPCLPIDNWLRKWCAETGRGSAGQRVLRFSEIDSDLAIHVEKWRATVEFLVSGYSECDVSGGGSVATCLLAVEVCSPNSGISPPEFWDALQSLVPPPT